MWRLLLGTMGVKSLVQGFNASATAGFESRTVWSEVRRRNRLATSGCNFRWARKQTSKAHDFTLEKHFLDGFDWYLKLQNPKTQKKDFGKKKNKKKSHLVGFRLSRLKHCVRDDWENSAVFLSILTSPCKFLADQLWPRSQRWNVVSNVPLASSVKRKFLAIFVWKKNYWNEESKRQIKRQKEKMSFLSLFFLW